MIKTEHQTIQILRKNGIVTLRDLTRTSGIELLRIEGLGNSVFKEIESGLKEFGLRLAPSKKERVVDIRTLSLLGLNKDYAILGVGD